MLGAAVLLVQGEGIIRRIVGGREVQAGAVELRDEVVERLPAVQQIAVGKGNNLGVAGVVGAIRRLRRVLHHEGDGRLLAQRLVGLRHLRLEALLRRLVHHDIGELDARGLAVLHDVRVRTRDARLVRIRVVRQQIGVRGRLADTHRMRHGDGVGVRDGRRDARAAARDRHRVRRVGHLIRRQRRIRERGDVGVKIRIGLLHPGVLDFFLVEFVIFVLLAQHTDLDHGVNVDARAGQTVDTACTHVDSLPAGCQAFLSRKAPSQSLALIMCLMRSSGGTSLSTLPLSLSTILTDIVSSSL